MAVLGDVVLIATTGTLVAISFTESLPWTLLLLVFVLGMIAYAGVYLVLIWHAVARGRPTAIPWWITVGTPVAVCFVGSMDNGLISGLELLGALVYIIPGLLNWLALSYSARVARVTI
jgi:hypothetical protein